MKTTARSAWLLAVSLLSPSCGGKAQGIVATRKAPSDTVWITAESRAAPLPAELQHLVTTVEELPRTLDQRSHAGLVRALRALAEGVRSLGPTGDERAAQIEATVEKLRRSTDDERARPELVRAALDEALRAIREAQPDPVDGARRGAYVASVRAWKQVAHDRSLLQQAAQVQLAFVTIANALAISRDLTPPFAGLAGTREHRPDLDAFVTHIKRADALAAAVATAQDSVSARMRTAETLEALADAVASAPSAAQDAAAQATVIGFEAARLERASVFDFRRVDWAQAGLLAAVHALAKMVPSDAPIIGQLRASAARAVAAIDAGAPFTFQRPAIQDALRAVISTYQVLATQERQRAGTPAK